MSARDFVMKFGKYKGETLQEIYIEDVGYLEWLKDATKPGELIHDQIEQCFKEMRNVRICK